VKNPLCTVQKLLPQQGREVDKVLGQYNSIISVSQQPKISVGFLRLSAANSAKIFSQLVKICY